MARPFMLEPDPALLVHCLRIQNLLKELMTLLRRMPSYMIGDVVSGPTNNINIIYSDEQRERFLAEHRQEQNPTRAHNRRLQREFQRELREREQREQRPLSLPDVVMSCARAAGPPPPPPPPPPPSPPQQQQSAADGEDRIAGAVKLQVAVCPTCYYGKERKLKVIAVAKLDENGKPIRWTNRDDEEPVVDENKSSKVKRRIMSLFQPSQIESSVLTAMFVIIGWKIFIKQ